MSGKTDGSNPTSKVTCNQLQGYTLNKRKAIFAELDKNPLLTPSQLSKVLGLPAALYKADKNYIRKLKHEWKCNHPKERGSIRSFPDEVHNVFFKGELSVEVVRGVRGEIERVLGLGGGGWCFGVPFSGVGSGWTLTKSRNHYLLYKNGLGRIRLFDSGTVEIFVRKPASKGKAMQLFSYAFTRCGLIDSIAVLEKFQKGLLTRMHAAFDTGQRLPYVKVNAFKESHGFTFVSGDRSDPTKFEFMFEYNSEVVGAREIFAQVGELLKSLGGPSEAKRLSEDYSR